MNIPPLNSPLTAPVHSRSAESAPSALRDAFAQQSVAQAQNASPTREDVEKAAQQVNDFLKPINNSIQFNVDDDTGITVVKIVDLSTKEVVRQIPSQEMLSIAQAIDTMKGLLVQQKA